MGDTGSLKVRRRPNKNSSKVNRIVSLFEIPRPNKQRGLQRTNSLPATTRPVFYLEEDKETNTQTTPSSTLSSRHNETGRVRRIKEEIEQKTKSEENNKTPTFTRKKRRSKRRNHVSESSTDSVLEEEKKKIEQNLIDISNRVGKIKVVTEHIEHSDTELEITFNNFEEHDDNVFQNLEECNEEIEVRDKVVDEDSDENRSRLSSDTVVNRLTSDSSIEIKELDEAQVKVGYGNYDVNTGVVSFSNSTSSESEVDDELSQETDGEGQDDLNVEKKFGKGDDPNSDNEEISTFLWVKNRHEPNNNHENDNVEGSTKTEKDDYDEKITEDAKIASEVDSISWWRYKSFVQVNNNSLPEQTDAKSSLPNYSEENNSDYTEASTNTLEKGRLFIKNQAARRSQRNGRRRTGVLSKSGTVKDLAQRFEGFKDAAEKGETEHYRRSFIDEMDKELENMKNDGFDDDLHLSFENLTVLDYEDDDDDVNKDDDTKQQKYFIAESTANSDEDTDSLSQTAMVPLNSQENQNDLEDLYSVTDDDLFGETLFSEDLEHGLYYVETYNADGKELIMCSIQIDRQSVDLNKFDEVKSQSKSKLLAQQDDEKTLILMGEAESSYRRSSLNDSNNGTDSKRTTIYSTTSGDSFEDRLTDDEGIDIETSSSSYGYSAARRETYCDDQGIVRIERIAPYLKNVEKPSEYVDTANYYYSIDPKNEEEEENYYDTIRLEHEITACVPEVKKETLQYIVEEIKATERKYVNDMRRVLNEYKPFLEERCPDKVAVVFGNMEEIYLKQIEFLEILDNSGDEIKDVVQAFIDFEDLFRLYPRYFRNTPKANVAVKELADFIKEKQEQLNDKLHLSAYLLTPLQRLGKYKLFLENITKQLKKENKSIGAVQMALELIKKYMSRGNDAVAVASILHSPLHFKDYGSFVTREKFTLIKPKRMELMVFLFQEVVVFTTEDQTGMDQFIYWQSINTDDLRIATFDDTTLHLTDYTKTKRRNTSKHTYVLEARTQKLKNVWKQEIEDILWKQLKKVKENTLKEYQSGKKVPKKFLRNRIKSTAQTEYRHSHPSMPIPARSTFYYTERSIRERKFMANENKELEILLHF